MSVEGQGKQPPPAARERRVRSITISSTKVETKQSFSNEAKHDLLDQEALLDFTHPHLRRSCTMTGREAQHQIQAMSQNPCLSLGKAGLSEKENRSKDKPKPPMRNSDFSSIPKPKLSIKQQQAFVPSTATNTQTFLSESADAAHRQSQSVFDGLTTQRKCADYPQNRWSSQNYIQTAGSTSNNKSYEHMRSAALPTTPNMSFSTEPLLSQSTVSPNIKTRRGQYHLHNETKVDIKFPSGSNLRRPTKENNAQTITGNSTLFQQTGASQRMKSPQRHRFWSKAQSQTAQMDVQSTVSQSDCFTKDYSCQSRGIHQKTEASHQAHRLNPLKTCLVVPQTQEASRPPSAERTTPQTGSSSTTDIPPQKHLLDHKQPLGQNNNHNEVTLSDTRLNQTDHFAPPDHHRVPTELPERPSEKCVVSWPPPVAGCPSNTNSCGTGSKGVFDLPSQPQHKVYQRPEESTTSTAASLPPNQVDSSLANRAFIMEEPEDPYYVTMYYPGSVYVDMSDVVPPEVRPKPAVPAKPPNVGAPSPSSPFPPQGPGAGAGSGGVSAPPPSGIPVPIGSHGPGHAAGHGIGHGVGHGGGHATAHSGGHGHGGCHSSSGGSTLLGYIGIDTIIEQMRKKTMKTGFDFNIMVVGHSGLGKSTLVNTLFKSQVSRRSAGWARDEKIPKTVEIKAVCHVIEEGGVKMKLTVVDTPGFGDQINNDNCSGS
ncbi:neuronal-specific septin-3 isoform X2 [Trachinotus anak]|uniref:neuronal-specific septin-3 isoform X2 n=1 Tax=Trachinotus anak TaxID=443729 RepID=UPI0039F1AEB3